MVDNAELPDGPITDTQLLDAVRPLLLSLLQAKGQVT